MKILLKSEIYGSHEKLKRVEKPNSAVTVHEQ